MQAEIPTCNHFDLLVFIFYLAWALTKKKDAPSGASFKAVGFSVELALHTQQFTSDLLVINS